MMKLLRAVPLAVLALVLPGCPKDTRAIQDQEAIQGTWTIIRAETNGEQVLPSTFEVTEWIFKGDKVFYLGQEATFQLKARVTPRQIDFVKGKDRRLGIYELRENTLRVCIGSADKRPDEFRTLPQSGSSYYLLQRKPKETEGE
jgi:uncharacterized protein (TIGR03067 family)